MKKKVVCLMCVTAMAASILGGCGTDTGSADSTGSEENSASSETGTEDSADESEEEKVYTADDVLAPLSYDVTEYVTLNDYMNMTVTMDTSYEVTDEDIEEQLEAIVSMYPNIWVASDKTTVEDGDMVTIDYVGYLDGEEFDGGSAEDYDLTIGSDSFVDGFEDGLIGGKLGGTVTVDVTFPDDYGVETLNGQDVQFEVEIKAIKEKQEITYEEVSDQWVKDNFYSSMSVSTLDEFREYLQSYLEALNESSQDDDEDTALMNQMLEECTVTIPDGYLEERVADYKEAVYAAAEENGKSLEEYVGMTEEEYETYLESNMIQRVKKDLIFEALVADMDYSFTQSDYDDYISSWLYAKEYETAEELYEAAEGASELTGEQYFMLSYAEHQVWAKIKANVEFVESE